MFIDNIFIFFPYFFYLSILTFEKVFVFLSAFLLFFSSLFCICIFFNPKFHVRKFKWVILLFLLIAVWPRFILFYPHVLYFLFIAIWYSFLRCYLYVSFFLFCCSLANFFVYCYIQGAHALFFSPYKGKY